MIDYHTHSKYSDGKNTYQEMVLKAQNLGLKEIGLSDHFCLEYPKWAIKKQDYNKLIKEINELKTKHNSNTKIKFGLETDYLPDKENEIKNYLNQFPLDYVIGSIHYIGKWNFDTLKKSFQNIDISAFSYLSSK